MTPKQLETLNYLRSLTPQEVVAKGKGMPPLMVCFMKVEITGGSHVEEWLRWQAAGIPPLDVVEYLTELDRLEDPLSECSNCGGVRHFPNPFSKAARVIHFSIQEGFKWELLCPDCSLACDAFCDPTETVAKLAAKYRPWDKVTA